ncbi:hypothetical protein DUNSADRAFT_9358 [Dunaliella salina]|uniref:Uncharacterized protein n=1 Tax=Dunaliella salina TaxID=3046 RepID=A0ABQ7H5H7_DUNSA|nr:hypothetical protein DUNSADRAFT_9358 [Dunaliella salina]|eukprot:KAF5842099.1 hypothetical protein DUNSADRAFT_9358 [Dunaliella salina]
MTNFILITEAGHYPMEEYEEFDGSIGSKSNAFILLSEEEEEGQQGVTAFQSLYPQKTLNHQATCQDERQQEHQKQESQQLEQQQQQAQHEQQPQAQAEQQQRQQQQQQQQGQGQQGEQPRPQKEQAEAQQQPKQQHKKRQKEQQQKQKEQAEQQAARAAMLELQAARLPKPWSADDVNPVCLPPAATSWLLPPSYTTSTKDATEAIEAAAALADRHTPRERKAIDLRKMSRINWNWTHPTCTVGLVGRSGSRGGRLLAWNMINEFYATWKVWNLMMGVVEMEMMVSWI